MSEIVRIQGCKKRADIHSVSQAVTARHGLAKSHCEAQLQNMIDHGILKNVKSHGPKSLSIVKSKEAIDENGGNIETSTQTRTTKEQFADESQSTSASIHRAPENTEGKNKTESTLSSHNTNEENDITTPNDAENENDGVPNSGSPHCDHTVILNLLGNSIKDLTYSLTRTNEMLLEEREYSRKLEREIMELKLRLIETKNSNKYSNPDYHQGPCYVTTQTGILLSSDSLDSSSDSDLDSSEKANEERRKAPTRIHNQNNSKSVKRQKRVSHRNPSNNNPSNTRRENLNKDEEKASKDRDNSQLTVTIVGDSQVNRLDGGKLNNNKRKVELKTKGGMKIKDVVEKVGISKSNVIIVHAGTCDIKAKTPEELKDEIITTLQAVKVKNRRSQIAFSSILRRKDSELLNVKVKEVNELLKEELELHGIDFIENENILFSNVGSDGLHINPGGVRKLAGNFTNNLQYC